jgi:hypothetical protein
MTAVGSRRRQWALGAALLFGAPALIGGLLALVFVALGSISVDTSSSSQGFFTRTTVAPIPISQRACPYLKAVRTTADTAGRTSMDLLEARSASRAQVELRSTYPNQLAALDLSVRVAAAVVPKPISAKLSDVAANVEADRKLLRATHDPAAFSSRGIDALVDGTLSLQAASDLVGNACGFTLSDFVM